MDVHTEQQFEPTADTLLGMNNENADERPENPVLQILSIGRRETGRRPIRFNIIFGDSVHFQRGVLTPELNHLVHGVEKFSPLSVVSLKRYDITILDGVPKIVVFEMAPVSPPLTQILGDPVDISDECSAYKMEL